MAHVTKIDSDNKDKVKVEVEDLIFLYDNDAWNWIDDIGLSR